jgi:hypothetical protein
MCVWAQWGSKSVPGSPHDPPGECKCKITTQNAICDGRVDELEYQAHSIEQQKKNSLCSKTVKSNVTPSLTVKPLMGVITSQAQFLKVEITKFSKQYSLKIQIRIL